MAPQRSYYSVLIRTVYGRQTMTVYAVSDYAAARQVRDMTGYMAKNEYDVTYIAPAFPVRRKDITDDAALPFLL